MKRWILALGLALSLLATGSFIGCGKKTTTTTEKASGGEQTNGGNAEKTATDGGAQGG